MVARLCQARRRYVQQVYKAPVTMVRGDCCVCGIRRLQTVSLSARLAAKLYKARCVFIVTKYRSVRLETGKYPYITLGRF